MNQKTIIVSVIMFFLLVVFVPSVFTTTPENVTVTRSGSWDETCSPLITTEDICRWECTDWDTYENGTVYCLGGYDNVCRNNTITTQQCSRTLYSGQMNYFNGEEYVPIDTTIVSSSDSLYDYEVTAGAYHAFFKANPTEGQVVRYSKDNVNITFQPMALNYRNDLDQIQQVSMIQSMTGEPDDNEFVYENAYGSGINLTYNYHNEQLKETLKIESFSDLATPEQYIIDGGNATLDLDFVMTTNSQHIMIEGADWDKSTTTDTYNEVLIKDSEGKTLYKFTKPYAYDSVGNQTPLAYRFKKSGTSLYVVIRTNYSWLQNAVYPVIIDPTIQLQDADTENLEDTYVYEYSPDEHEGSGISLGIAGSSSGTKRRSYIKFNISSIPTSMDIISAKLFLYHVYYTTAAVNATLHHIYNQTWTEDDSDTWNTQVCGIDFDDSAQCNLTYESETILPQSTSSGWRNWTTTNSVKKSYDDSDLNVSFVLKEGTETDDTYQYVRSKDYTTDTLLIPYLNITYHYTTNQNISDCTVLDSPGITYFLDADITDSSTSNCMDITANNVTLDCQGYTIDGNDFADYGIRIYRDSTQTTNITIKNCTLTDWDMAGVYLYKSQNNILQDLNSSYNSEDGILIEQNSYYNNLTNIITNNNGNYRSGVHLDIADHCTLTNITANNNGQRGIYLNQCENITINDSVAKNNGLWDIYYSPEEQLDCRYTTFNNVNGTEDKSILYYNSQITLQNLDNISTIILCNADNSTLENITMDRTGIRNNGIYIHSTSNTSLTNISLTNLEYGIYTRNSDLNNFTDITITYSDNHGMYIYYSDNNIFKNITIKNNDYDGLILYGSDSNTVYNSTIQDNCQVSYSGQGFWMGHYSNDNIIYNNIFNNSVSDSCENINIASVLGAGPNNFNTTKQTGTRIYSDGTHIGGNYYTNSMGNGYSDTCADTNRNGFCDNSHTFLTDNVDYLPLSDGFGPPEISDAVEPTDPTVYDESNTYMFNITACYNIDTVIFEWDGTNETVTTKDTINSTCSEYYTTKTQLTVNTYNYVWYSNDTIGNASNSVSDSFTVSKATPSITVYANGSSSDTSMPSGNMVNMTGSIVSNDNDLTVYLSLDYTGFGDDFDSGTNVITNESDLVTIGTYNLTASTTGNANYTSASHMLWLEVVSVNAPTYSNLKTTHTSPVEYNPALEHMFNSTWQDLDNDLEDVIFNWNGTTNYTYSDGDLLNETSEFYINFTNLTVCNYTYYWCGNDTGGSESCTSTYWYNYTKNYTNAINMTFYYNGVTYINTNISVDTVTTATIDGGLIYDDTGTIEFYVDSGLISIPYTNTFGLGVHNITATTSGNDNYSSNTTSYYITAIYVTPGGGGGGGATTTCGDNICEYPETSLTCPIDCKNASFYIDPMFLEYPALPGSSIVCIGSLDGCVISVNNDGIDDINITVTITATSDDSHEWANLIDGNGNKTKTLDIFVAAKTTELVVVSVYVPNGTEEGSYEFNIEFESGVNKIIFKYFVDVSYTAGGFAGLFIALGTGFEIYPGFVWYTWYSIAIGIFAIVASFSIWARL